MEDREVWHLIWSCCPATLTEERAMKREIVGEVLQLPENLKDILDLADNSIVFL